MTLNSSRLIHGLTTSELKLMEEGKEISGLSAYEK